MCIHLLEMTLGMCVCVCACVCVCVCVVCMCHVIVNQVLTNWNIIEYVNTKSSVSA